MKFKYYFLMCFFLASVSFIQAQETTPNVPTGPNYVGTVASMTYVASIESRYSQNNLPKPAKGGEAQDKRSLGNTVIVGKDKQTTDDYYVLNRHEMEQSVRVAPPSLVFDAYSSVSQPTDPSLAVGPNHVMVTFNTAITIYDKLGNVLMGPFAPNPTIFPSGGCCDLTASYDNAADRWVLSLLGSGAQVAVSDGSDPTSAGWYVYNVPAINDYQKLSVWRDGYYMTDNTSSTNKVWALERDKMLAGDASAQIMGFNLPGIVTSGFYSPQALNISDDTIPTTGGATFIYLQDDAWSGVTEDHVKFWNLDVDWGAGTGTMSAATTFGLSEGVQPFISVFDGGSFSNLTQPGGGVAIDALQATIMNQAQFRKFATHNSAVFNFVVDTDASSGELAGVRWFEFRQAGDGLPWSLYQSGTYTAPQGRHAWHASMIMDANGNIGMGYTSMAGPTTPNPTDHRVSSYYTGRFDGDPLGVMTVAEELIAAGTANIPGLRYGDYSKIDIDPTDDATFWFINEYMNPNRKGVVGVFQLTPPGPDDIGVTNITAPVDGPLTNAESITIEIRNFGNNDITNPEVQYILNSGTPVVENYSGTITAGTTVSYTFSTQGDFSAAGNHTIVARTNLTGDTNPANDDFSKTVYNGVLYCEPDANCSFGDGMTLFSIAEINNTSGCESYADFTNLIANLEQDTTYDLTITTGYGNQFVTVWIDFNDNGTFETSEVVVNNYEIADGQGAGTYTETMPLVVPAGAATGEHRMRAKTNWNAPVPADACVETAFGETEDYTANIGQLGLEDVSISNAEFIVVSLPNNQFDIMLKTTFDGTASIAVYNVLGQTLAFNNLQKEGDSFNYHLDMSYANAGVYFVKIGDRTSNSFKTAKIIVK